MKTSYPTREASSKTLSRTRVQNSLKERVDTYDNQTNRIVRSRMGTGYLQDSIIYKNMKLSTMVENLSSFARCLDDTKWIFDESYRLIKELLAESLELYQDAPSRRIRVDSIAKEYSNLKRRFDVIDMGEIHNIVESYMGQQRTLESITVQHKQQYTVPLQQSKPRKSSLVVGNTVANTINLNSKASYTEESSTLKAKLSELQTSNTEQSRLNEQLASQLNQQYRTSQSKCRQNQQLRAIILNSRQNELCAVNKLKLTLRKLKQMSENCPDRDLQLQHIDALILNLSAFQQRIRDQMANITQHQQSTDELTVKKQMLQGEVRTLRLDIDNLRDQKHSVENYINQLQEQLKSKSPNRTKSETGGDEYFSYILLQASAIQNFLK